LPSCLIGIEACASSHHWSRELQALGHTVRLMPPAYVKPYAIVDKKPTTTTETTVVGDGVYKTRVEAETGMKTVKVCTTN
jgi:transposase